LKYFRLGPAGAFLLLVFLALPLQTEAKQKHLSTAMDPDSSPSDSSWYVGLGLGMGAPLSGWDPDYLLAGGGTVFAGCRLDKSLAVQLDIDQWFYAGGGTSVYDFRLLPVLRLNLDGKNLRPYFLAGPGYDIHSDSPSGYSTSALCAVAGAGLEYDLGKKDHLFLEVRYNLLFYQDTTLQDVPILAGLSDDL
jgi:hypothetical protein